MINENSYHYNFPNGKSHWRPTYGFVQNCRNQAGLKLGYNRRKSTNLRHLKQNIHALDVRYFIEVVF